MTRPSTGAVPLLSDREAFASFLLRMRARGPVDPGVLAAFEATPRAGFLPPDARDLAWSSRMAPIPCGEAVEGADLQASVIAALRVEAQHTVLEVGTGTGYTAAVLARLARRVVTMERFRTLAEEARERLAFHGLRNVTVRHGDGARGSEDGPFDRIVYWAAFEAVPRGFAERLATQGVMIAPVGPADGPQTLMRFQKVGSRFETEALGPVRLQPLAGRVAAYL